MFRSLSLFFVLALLGACGAASSSVPIKGSDGDRARLAGEWKGEFEGVNNGRKGTIDFTFEMGRHTADAKVVLDIGGEPVALKVAYLQVDAGHLIGVIEPYQDPTCDCTVETRFEGSVSPGYVIGTYKVNPATGEAMIGNWSLERVAD